MSIYDKPLAAAGYTSYRARGRYGWIMIGANSTDEAWSEARRSTDKPHDLQVWDGQQYVPVEEGVEAAQWLLPERAAIDRRKVARIPVQPAPIDWATECVAANDDRDDAADELARCLREDHEENAPQTSGMYADLITAALGAVDWRELAEHMLEDVEVAQ